MRSRVTAVLAALLLISRQRRSLDAQYFGRNKVQYERSTSRCSRPSTSTSTTTRKRKPRSSSPRAWPSAGTRASPSCLQHELQRPAAADPLRGASALPADQHPRRRDRRGHRRRHRERSKRRVILPFAGGLAETDHVLGHELVHAFQYDMASRTDIDGRPVGPGLQALPLWFIEGMAEYLSIGPVDANTAMWVRDASSRDKMPTDRQARRSRFLPVSLRPRVLGVRRRPLGRSRRRRPAARDRSRGRHRSGDRRRARRRPRARLTTEWHEATRRTFAAIFETTRPAERVRPRADLARAAAAAT